MLLRGLFPADVFLFLLDSSNKKFNAYFEKGNILFPFFILLSPWERGRRVRSAFSIFVNHHGRKKKPTFWTKIRNQYRLVVMNDDTFEEQFSLKLTPLNIFIAAGLVSIIMITLTVSLVAFTPLREYIPGYGAEVNTRKDLVNLTLKLDSLQNELALRAAAMDNIKNIMSGNVGSDSIRPAKFKRKKELLPQSGIKANLPKKILLFARRWNRRINIRWRSQNEKPEKKASAIFSFLLL